MLPLVCLSFALFLVNSLVCMVTRTASVISERVKSTPHATVLETGTSERLTLLVAQSTQVEFADAGPLDDARRARSGEPDRGRGEGSESSDDERRRRRAGAAVSSSGSSDAHGEGWQ